MILLLNGCINAGKSRVAQALTRLLPGTAHVELDALRGFCSWLPLAEAIPVTLEAAVAVTKVLAGRGMNAVLTWPLREEDYAFLVAHLQPLGVPIHAVTLDADEAVLLSDRGGRMLTHGERARILEMRREGYHQRGFGTVIDTTGRNAEQTAGRVLENIGVPSGPHSVGRPWASKRLGAAAVIQDELGQVLLVRHGYGMLNWELPGGAAEAEEAASQTAVREVREETGLLVRAERLTGVYYMGENDSHHFVFTCRLTQEAQEPHPDLVEITECGYFAPDSLPRPISDFTVRRIEDALSGQGLPCPRPIGPRQWLE